MDITSVANGHVNGLQAGGDIEMNGAEKSVTHEGSVRFATGLILPPPEIKCEHNVL